MSSAYQTARDQGYSDSEIYDFLRTHPSYSDKIREAEDEGYSSEDITSFLSTYTSSKKEKKPKRSTLEKGARVAAQYGIGAAESALLPYEVAVVPLASKDAQNVAYRETLSEDLERLMEQKQSGDWDEQDENLLQSIIEQIKDPRKSEEFAQTANIGVRGLAEKATGVDLKPEGALEKAASWTGFIKDPKKIAELAKVGISSKELIKAIFPTGKEAKRGLGAGIFMEMAEQGDLGPIGTMAAAVIGDLAGGGAAGLVKGTKELLTKPKETLAKTAAKFSPKQKVELQKDLIQDFRKSGIQADVGTLTDSELLKWMQTRLSQSGLTGKALEDLRLHMTSQIKNEYESLAKSLGEAKFTTTHEAGQAVKSSLQKIRETDLNEIRNLYANADKALRANAYVDSNRLASAIENLEKQIKPGSLKAGEQQAVLNALKTLKGDIQDAAANTIFADVKELMNNKIALNDIINYEVQGGAKQLLKQIVGEIDRAIISHGKENPSFARNYISANKRFSQHAKTFRNRNIDTLLRDSSDPEMIFNKMNSIESIRSLRDLLKKSKTDPQLFNNLARLKLDRVVGDHMVDSTTQQLKLGTFSKLLEKGKNRQIIKELLDPMSFKRLERLQKNSGKLADTAQKFLNASKSGVTVTDVGIVSKAMWDMSNLFAGNPWPAMKTAGGIVGARYLTKLMGDSKFLKLVEEAILASEKNDMPKLLRIGSQMEGTIKAAIQQTQALNKVSEPMSENQSAPIKGQAQ